MGFLSGTETSSLAQDTCTKLGPELEDATL